MSVQETLGVVASRAFGPDFLEALPPELRDEPTDTVCGAVSADLIRAARFFLSNTLDAKSRTRLVHLVKRETIHQIEVIYYA